MSDSRLKSLDAKLGVPGYVFVSIAFGFLGLALLFVLPPVGILFLPAFAFAAVASFVRAILLA